MNISVFINNLIKYAFDIFEDFIKFIIANRLLGLFMAAIIGIAITTLASSFKVNIVDYYLNKLFRTTNNNLINLFTSLVQSILIVILLYFIYNSFIKPIEHRYTIRTFNDIEWKNNLLSEIREIKNHMK
jgi:large-conductance mechanosensitive channel